MFYALAFALLLIQSAAHANTVMLSSATPSGAGCQNTVAATPVATLTLLGDCTQGNRVSLTASSLQDFISSITGSGQEGDIAFGSGLVDGRTISAFAFGGSGAGFVAMNYTDQFRFDLGFLGGRFDVRFGDTGQSFIQTGNQQIAAGTQTHTILMPIFFGQAFDVPMDQLTVSYYHQQSTLRLTASETVNFDLYDANMNLLPSGSVATATMSAATVENPEPSTAMLGIGGLLVILAMRRKQKRPEAIDAPSRVLLSD